MHRLSVFKTFKKNLITKIKYTSKGLLIQQNGRQLSIFKVQKSWDNKIWMRALREGTFSGILWTKHDIRVHLMGAF